MKKRSSRRDWMPLLAFGLIGYLFSQLLIGVIALVIGSAYAYFTDTPWYIASLITFLLLRLVLGIADGLADGLGDWKSTVCTECKKKIKTSRPVKCVECGGAALLK